MAHTVIDEDWLALQGNEKFLRCVLPTSEESTRGKLHRALFRGVFIYYGTGYLSLEPREIRAGYQECLHQLRSDIQYRVVNTQNANLHELLFTRWKKAAFGHIRAQRRLLMAKACQQLPLCFGEEH